MLIDLRGNDDRIIKYKINGTSIDQLNTSMYKNSLTKYAGYTLHHYRYEPSNRGMTVIYEIVTILPEWNEKGAKLEVIEEWKRFITLLTSHEGNHKRLDERAYKRMKELGNPDLFEKIKDKVNQYNEEYDTLSKHGTYEGAKLGFIDILKDFSKEVDDLIKQIAEFRG